MMNGSRFPSSSCLWAVVLVSATLVGPMPVQGSDGVVLENLMITVTDERPREFIYTDKGAAHLAGEAVGPDTRSYHGFYIAMHEVLDGWVLRLQDGTELGPKTAFAADVMPDQMIRRHRLPGGEIVSETVQLFDGENGFRVVYDGVPSGAFELVPRIDMRFLWRVGKPAYEIRWEDGMLLACRQDALQEDPDPAHPAWLAIAVRGADGFRPDGRHVTVNYPKSQAREAMATASPYLPGSITGRIPPRIPDGKVEVVFAADVTAAAAGERVRRLRFEASALVKQRQERLRQLIAATRIRTGNETDDRALAWARVSLDNLIMNQRGPGIYAGFYWFTTYWGRDTFISLPGACITSGDFETARTLLRGFAEFQNMDPTSDRAGRLPNFVTVDQVQYASIDGTWWFVRALDELWRASGDDAFAAEMAPVVSRAVAGALQHGVDAELFLTHGDGETWMDAGGEDHPYSPRGNRAVEVQALWHRGLLAAARLAERFGSAAGDIQSPDAAEAARLRELAQRLAGEFHARYWDGRRLVDHLNADGSQDHQLRPNGLLAVLASPTLFTAEQRSAVTDMNAEFLVRAWGVISLTEADPAFHPRHLDLQNYYYDEAYHNGDLWLWLSGAYVSAVLASGDAGMNAALEQTGMLLTEILDEGAVGTLQEIRDGALAASNDEFGGATSQAWSLAELLRNLSDDYLGLEVDLTATPPEITLDPNVPDRWPHLEISTRIGENPCTIRCQWRDGEPVVSLRFRDEPPEAWVYRLRGSGDSIREGHLTPDPERSGLPFVVEW